MDTLAAACVGDAGVDGCGVSIRDTQAHNVMVHATNPVAAAIEDLQLTLGEGPCVDVERAGTAVMVPDLGNRSAAADGWPVFRAELNVLGVSAVFAFPIRVGPVALGVLDLYRATPGPLSEAQLSSTLSTINAIGRHLVAPENVGASDQEDSISLVVHRAAGMVMVQLDNSIEEALVRLRASAYADGRPVADLAADVIRGDLRFRKEQP
jgi:GAF domain-containing protein